MKRGSVRRRFRLLLVCLLLLNLLPMQAFAVEENAFILVAEADGKLIIAPEYVSYAQGQTIAQALAASGHSFGGLDTGMVSDIDGVVGEFTRSDESGSFSLDAPASSIQLYRFSEEMDSRPSEGLRKLMTAMADYAQESGDVRAAAKEAYATAYAQFVGADSASAKTLAVALAKAVSDYKTGLEGPACTVSFTQSDAVITMTNPYGRIWNGDEAGRVSLPAGAYHFCVERSGLRAEGDLEVSGDRTVAVTLPENQWLTVFRLSGSYGADSSEEGSFTDDEFTLSGWENRAMTVPVPDVLTGSVYAYVDYDATQIGNARLSAIYTAASSGEQKQQSITFKSLVSGTPDTLQRGAEGNTVIYRVSSTAADGYTYSQDYTVCFARVPTLSGISVKDQNGLDQAATERFTASKTEYDYKVLDTVTAVTIRADSLSPDYAVSVNGQNARIGARITLNADAEGNPTATQIPVQVTGNGYTNTYTLNILPGEGQRITFITTAANVTVQVVNSNDMVMPYERYTGTDTYNRYRYTLVAGEEYRYVATRNTYYHVADSFSLDELANNTVTVDAPGEDWLTALSFGTGGSGSKYKGTLSLDSGFATADHRYRISYVDTEHMPYTWVTFGAGISAEAVYTQLFNAELYHGKELTKALTSGKTTGVLLNRFLMDENPHGNTVTIRLSKEADGVTYYQDYLVEFVRALTLENMTAACDGKTVILTQEHSNTTGFRANVMEYTLTVPMAAKNLALTLTKHNGSLCYGEEELGYRVYVNGTEVADGTAVDIALDGTIHTQTVTIRVENSKAPEGTAEYTLHILKSPPVETAITTAPENALLALYQADTGERIYPNENGTYYLSEGFSYHYALTCYGYVSMSGTLDVTRNADNALVVTDGDTVYAAEENEYGGGNVAISWSIDRAPVNNAINTSITAEWADFRGSATNNGITDAQIPTAAEDGTLYWANQIGSGYDADAVGSPIIVDGDILTYASDKLYRIDTVTGEIKAVGMMDHKSSFSITPPVYADGMVFVALSNGTVQAFNAATLEGLWLYTDPLGGQPNCPLTVHNGYLYTGFWNSETGNANFVCLSITDENPAKTKEPKTASWYYTQAGGFYWAGAYVCDDYVIVGTDDGKGGYISQTSKLLLLDSLSGKVLDAWENLNADVRSTVVYDTVTNAYYFTSKGGTFYSTQVAKTAAGFAFTNQWSIALENGTGGVPMSTCSPVVYNGRAYVGVSGSGQFSAYSGHNITVINLSNRKIAYRVNTQGYPQTSGLLTTAYASDDGGYVYIYYFDNMTPGKLRVLRDKAGQTKADYLTVEHGKDTAYALFTPTGNQAQYAICSPIVDAYGTIYFKNDSAHLMAYGSAITQIEVTKQPDKLQYAEGECFDPTGMVVTATYANGKTRDITEYVTYPTEALTAEDTTLTISFEYVMYHNAENGTQMDAGISTQTPVTTLELTIGNQPELGDVNADGRIDMNDAVLVAAYYNETAELTQAQLEAADVNKDGKVDMNDAVMIAAYYNEAIDSFGNQG